MQKPGIQQQVLTIGPKHQGQGNIMYAQKQVFNTPGPYHSKKQQSLTGEMVP